MTLAAHPRVLAYIGDCVYELWVRKLAVAHAGSDTVEALHGYTTLRVKAEFQAKLLWLLEESLTDDEKEAARQGRNVKLTVSRRSGQSIYRQATAFETLIGYLHQARPERLQVIWRQMEPWVVEPESMPNTIAKPDETNS